MAAIPREIKTREKTILFLQERNGILEDLLHAERMLTRRNALVAIHFENALTKIAKLGASESTSHGAAMIAGDILDKAHKGELTHG